jgi:hypothetical protein
MIAFAPRLAMQKYSFKKSAQQNEIELKHTSTVTSTRAPSSSPSASGSVASCNRYVTPTKKLPARSPAEFLEYAAEAIHQAFLRGAEPALLASDVDVVLFCQQLARPDFDAEMRQSALKRVAVAAHSKTKDTEFVKQAQRVVIARFQRAFGLAKSETPIRPAAKDS